MTLMHLGNKIFRRNIKYAGVKLHYIMAFVPAAFYKSGAQINYGVQWKFLFSEAVYHAYHLCCIIDSTVGLHVAQCPFGW